MATDLTNLADIEILVSIKAKAEKATDGVSEPATDSYSYQRRIQLEFGTGEEKADLLWHDKRTLDPEEVDSLDLAGILKHAFGEATTFANVKAVIVANISHLSDPVSEAVIQVGAAAENAWEGPFADPADAFKVKAGGIFCLAEMDVDGLGPVTADTGDILAIENLSETDTAEYIIALLGDSA